MNSLNSVLIEGRVVETPALETTKKGNQVCRFRIASNRFFKAECNVEGELTKEQSIFEIEAWYRLGQSCADTLKKGRGIRVVGRLANRKEECGDAEYGPCLWTYIVAEHVEFKPGSDSSEEDNG